MSKTRVLYGVLLISAVLFFILYVDMLSMIVLLLVLIMPLLMLALCAASAALKLLRGVEPVDVAALPVWAMIYCLFALVGVLIAGLLHFALKKEG